MGLRDYLGEAAEQKKLAQLAIKEKRFDDAWGYLNNQKVLYLKHANRFNFPEANILSLDSSVHEDMANILRMEGRHKEALHHISYVYAAHFKANRPLITLEKKLIAYYKRVFKNSEHSDFISTLKQLDSADFISVRDLVN